MVEGLGSAIAGEMGFFLGIVQWTLLRQGQFLILHVVD